MSSQAIAKELGVTATSVKRWLKKFGVKMRPMGRGLANKEMPRPTKEDLERLTYNDLLSCQEIGNIYGVSQVMVSKWLIQHGIKRPRRWEVRHKTTFPDLPSVDELRSLYDSGMSVDTIAAQFGLEGGMLTRIMRNSGIEIRRRGWGEREQYICDNGLVVRSSYEMRVANWLLSRSIDFVYEPRLPFNKKWASDFYVNGWYIEIWGVNNSRRYQARKEEKIKAYEANNLPLLHLHDDNFTTRRNDWEKKLLATLNPPMHALCFL